MKTGISTKCFGGIDSAEAAEKISSAGFTAAELCLCQRDIQYWRYNAAGRLEAPSAEDFGQVCDIYREKNIDIVSLGVYQNLWSGNGSERFHAEKSLVEYMELAYGEGIPMLSTELGFAVGAKPIRGTSVRRRSYTDEDFGLLFEAFRFASVEAHKRGLCICIEPSVADMLESPDDYLSFVKRVESDTGTSDVLKFTLSPHCLGIWESDFDPSDFIGFVGKVGLIHIKEREKDSAFYCAAGSGFDRWGEFFTMFRDCPCAIVEYADDRNAQRVREFAESEMMK